MVQQCQMCQWHWTYTGAKLYKFKPPNKLWYVIMTIITEPFRNMSVHAACSTVVRPYKTHLPREGKAPLCSSIHSRSQLAGLFVLEVLSICKNLFLTHCVTNCGSWNWGQNRFQRSLWLLLLQISTRMWAVRTGTYHGVQLCCDHGNFMLVSEAVTIEAHNLTWP